jgi:hypothetical protein
MNRRWGHWLLMALAAWALAACSLTKPPPEPDPNIFPTAFRKEIIDTLSTTLGDPTNLRDASISDPVLGPVGKDQRYTVCVRFNERDSEHRYMGVETRIAYFYAGHLNQLVNAAADQCTTAAYKPFPELEKLCLSNKCN